MKGRDNNLVPLRVVRKRDAQTAVARQYDRGPLTRAELNTILNNVWNLLVQDGRIRPIEGKIYSNGLSVEFTDVSIQENDGTHIGNNTQINRTESRLRSLFSELGVPLHFHDIFMSLLNSAIDDKPGLADSLISVAGGMRLNHEPRPSETEDATPPPSENSSEQAALMLPNEIPPADLYKNRHIDPETGKKQSIIKFIETGWPAPYIKSGVLKQRSQLQGLDDSLYSALYTTEGKALPQGILPTKQHVLDEELNHVDRELLRKVQRLSRAQQRRRT
jgi:hypothetical protein